MTRPLDAAERALLDALRGLRFGSVEAVVHDGRIQRIERREKVRIDADPTTEGEEDKFNDPRQRPERRSPSEPKRGETR